MESPFHAGELWVQQKAGEERMAAGNGKVIANRIPNGALKFIDKQPMVIISSMDKTAAIWISVLAGQPGFVVTGDGTEIVLSKELTRSSREDIFFQNIKEYSSVGLLFIELATRRRLRVNGKIKESKDHLTVEVAQAYPNCPKYIQRREIEAGLQEAATARVIKKGQALDGELKHWFQSADTLFVGSANLQHEMDASHRGGNAGFIEVIDDGTIKVPDYVGNSMFNTLGNFAVNPKAGILLIDFTTGNTLQATGSVEIAWPTKEANMHTNDSGRYWLFHIDEWMVTNTLANTSWTYLDASPFNPS
jgi:uncharacterized protein